MLGRSGVSFFLSFSLLASLTINSESSSEKETADISELQMRSNWAVFLENTLLQKMGYKDEA